MKEGIPTNSRPASFTEQVVGQLGSHRVDPGSENQNQKKKKTQSKMECGSIHLSQEEQGVKAIPGYIMNLNSSLGYMRTSFFLKS